MKSPQALAPKPASAPHAGASCSPWDRGMSTAEYAIGTIAACSFAAILILIVRSDGVRSALTKVITTALSMG